MRFYEISYRDVKTKFMEEFDILLTSDKNSRHISPRIATAIRKIFTGAKSISNKIAQTHTLYALHSHASVLRVP